MLGFFVFGAPGGIRTPDQVVRSHLLYPAELRVRCSLVTVTDFSLLFGAFNSSALNIEACFLRHPILLHRRGRLSVQ